MNLYACDPSAVKEESEGWSKVQESNRLLEELLESVALKLVSSKNNNNKPYSKYEDSSSVDHWM